MGVHGALSLVIKLGIRHPRKKERIIQHIKYTDVISCRCPMSTTGVPFDSCQAPAGFIITAHHSYAFSTAWGAWRCNSCTIKTKKTMRRKPDFFVKQKDSSNKMQRRLLPESCSIFCPIEIVCNSCLPTYSSESSLIY